MTMKKREGRNKRAVKREDPVAGRNRREGKSTILVYRDSHSYNMG